MLNGEDVAFPTEIDNRLRPRLSGLTKREYFAAMALQGLITEGNSEGLTDIEIASCAVGLADALITMLNQDKANA